MAFRFRKSIKIVPGVRVNFGERGTSLSVGKRGASITIGKQGTYANVSIPGTGISFRERIDKESEQKRLQREEKRLLREYEKLKQEELRREALKNVTLELNDNGSINILNSFNEPLSRKDMKLLWEQHSEKIKAWLENQKNEINGDVDLLENIYQDTVEPNNVIEYIKKPFTKNKPIKPTFEHKPEYQPLPPLGFFAKFSKKKKEEYAQKVKEHEKKYHDELRNWENEKKHGNPPIFQSLQK